MICEQLYVDVDVTVFCGRCQLIDADVTVEHIIKTTIAILIETQT